ncbi:uncharacterized protein LOC107048683, partial [Diachasma alloeum]|uniref:uncharacterized protein LOC107048683 n=1 Tax=Diachasma alloeum TaxID=454923 RepID=UPI0007384DC8
ISRVDYLLYPQKGILNVEGKKFIIPRDNNKVGSLANCNIQLEHPSISKIHIRIDWTKVGLVVTNMTSSGKTFLNNVPMKPLEAKMIKRWETTLRLGEFEGHLSLHKKARKIARTASKKLQQSHSNGPCSKCSKHRIFKIQAVFDEKRKFHLKFVMPKRNVTSGDGAGLRRAALHRSLCQNFSHLSLITPEGD